MRVICSVVLVCGLLSAAALAQERRPLPVDLALSPNGDALIAVQARDSGLVVRDAQGQWHLWCARALGATSSARMLFDAAATDELVVGSYSGLSQANITSCTTTTATGLEDITVRTIQRDASDSDTLRAVVANNTVTSVAETTDAGRTWSVVQEIGGTDAYLDAIFAPSDPRRLYLFTARSDLDAGTTEIFLAVSDDGGASLREHALPGTPDALTQTFELLAVDREDPDKLYAAIRLIDAGAHMHPSAEDASAVDDAIDEVYESDDGGASWTSLRELRAFGGFAVSADGERIWIASMEGGLHRSTDGGASFEVLHDDVGLSCVHQQGDKLWVCADVNDEDFSVAMSSDDGETLQPQMRFDELVGPLDCGGVTSGICSSAWEQWRFWFGITAPDAGPTIDIDAGGAGGVGGSGTGATGGAGPTGSGGTGAGQPADASIDASTKANDDGCGCRMVGARRDDHGWLGSILLLGLLWQRRRSRRAHEVRAF